MTSNCSVSRTWSNFKLFKKYHQTRLKSIIKSWVAVSIARLMLSVARNPCHQFISLCLISRSCSSHLPSQHSSSSNPLWSRSRVTHLSRSINTHPKTKMWQKALNICHRWEPRNSMQDLRPQIWIMYLTQIRQWWQLQGPWAITSYLWKRVIATVSIITPPRLRRLWRYTHLRWTTKHLVLNLSKHLNKWVWLEPVVNMIKIRHLHQMKVWSVETIIDHHYHYHLAIQLV